MDGLVDRARPGVWTRVRQTRDAVKHDGARPNPFGHADRRNYTVQTYSLLCLQHDADHAVRWCRYIIDEVNWERTIPLWLTARRSDAVITVDSSDAIIMDMHADDVSSDLTTAYTWNARSHQ
jgi:hypothetical protein